jgi:dipeptidyl aminopeptidase/acylaminoacyl peptidase
MIATPIAIALAVAGPAPATAPCPDLLPPPDETLQAIRDVEAEDLVRLRDIGQPTDRIDLESPLAVSPDGKRIVFVIRRADPARNAYCQGLVLLDRLDPKHPRLLDTGGDIIAERYPLFGHALPESGVPAVIVPRWSPDGKHIAWLKRTGATAQLWITTPAGGDARPLSHEPSAVTGFAWSGDGSYLVVSTRFGEAEAEAEITREGTNGYLIDARVRPLAADRPFPRDDAFETRYLRIDARSGESDRAGPEEQALLAPPRPGAARSARNNVNGDIAWTTNGTRKPLTQRLIVQRGHKTISCTACAGEIADLWWSDDGALIFVRREGTARQSLTLYRWTARRDGPIEQLATTQDLILGCRPLPGRRIACLKETSLEPRYIALLDEHSGTFTRLWDPNPGFARRIRPRVERLFWTNDQGIETFGDLVLPAFAKAEPPYSLVVVQYGSRGFLRGGTGDEYPILSLAARGHAVLSFQRPLHLALAKPGQTDPLAERRHVQSALERGIAKVIARGDISAERIGITGLSDGATTVQWALLHGSRFAAAAMSTCCLDPGLLSLLSETQLSSYAKGGFPKPGETQSRFWVEASLSVNARLIDTPILMQLADDEFLGALEGFRALQAADKAVEMYVFPGERHFKRQPAHRLSIYKRNLMWFDFWLKDREEPLPTLADDYGRWRAMRARRETAARP